MRKVSLLILVALAALVVYAYIIFYPQLPIANGYAAKKMCSCTFIAGRTQEAIQVEDLGFGPLSLTKTNIDRNSKSVETTLFGLSPRTAVFREKLGCILLDGTDDYDQKLEIETPALPDSLYWPLGTNTTYSDRPENVDYDQLSQAINSAFDPTGGLTSQMTRAIVVVHKDQIIGEKYAEGYDAQTEILGWSMAKSLTSTLVGILNKNEMASLEEKNLFEEWNDERADIALKDLLQMQSGLAFNEDYGSISDATEMLFTVSDITSIPKSQKSIHAAGTHWSYSSGTTNLLSGFIRDRMPSHDAYLQLPYDSLFHRIGMTSAVLETDEAGTFIGSSYCYATPRDWAKFGLLYLHEGNWYGDQVVDTSWVDFVKIPASDSKGIYGGQFWLNVDHAQFKDAPEDLFSCNGFQGQFVFIIPSLDLVVVRMGLAEWPQFDPNKMLREIISCIKIEG